MLLSGSCLTSSGLYRLRILSSMARMDSAIILSLMDMEAKVMAVFLSGFLVFRLLQTQTMITITSRNANAPAAGPAMRKIFFGASVDLEDCGEGVKSKSAWKEKRGL